MFGIEIIDRKRDHSGTRPTQSYHSGINALVYFKNGKFNLQTLLLVQWDF